MLSEDKQLFCAFIDFTEAFDCVIGITYGTKLITLGLRGNILNIMRSMYDSDKSCVKCIDTRVDNGSEPFDCILGIRQGECLSTFLFSMFLNDIEDTKTKKGLKGIDVDTFYL